MTKSFSLLMLMLLNGFSRGARGEGVFPAAQGFATTLLLAIGLAFAGLFFESPLAHAQSPIFQKGDGVITGFSGLAVPDTAFPPGINPLDKILIDPEGASAQILRLAPQAPLQGQVLTPSVFKIKAREVGQVFGAALDDAPVRNIYLGATSAFGLQIVTPDTDGDGKPERSRLGSPNAIWMPGQFGNGGGPGSIYKVDGRTGAVSLFATIANNSGPGIGQIAFDGTSRQFFVSDLDTGLIHRIDISGKLHDSFDHGVAGRAAAQLQPVPDDGIAANIRSTSFNSEDPATWGYTPEARRVWGLAVNGRRLYYAVAEGPQVWSVAINPDGSFGSDPRIEIDASTLSSPNAIASISFDDNGLIYLAQRGGQRGSYDYSSFAEPNNAVVARYRRDPANPAAWMAQPEFYAIGSIADYRGATGGVDIGLGVAANGAPSGQCSMLWSTGDALKPFRANGFDGIVQGLQGNDINAVRPADAPPTQVNVVDYDQLFADPTAMGHVGSIVVWRDCQGAGAVVAQPAPYAPPASAPSYPPGKNVTPPVIIIPGCPPGYFFDPPASRCIRGMLPPVPNPNPTPPRNCPFGTEGAYPDCKPIINPPGKCEFGTHGIPPNCIRDLPPAPGPTPPTGKCEFGTHGTPPNCIRDLPPAPAPAPPTGKCGFGTHGTPPNCVRDVKP